jgi:PAS domain S-box-containing protein
MDATDINCVQNEQTLRDSEEMFRSLVETSADLVFRLDRIGHIQYINPRVYELYGYQVDELIGRNIEVTTPADQIPKAMEAISRALAGESVRDFEINQKDKAGRIIPMEINAMPVTKNGQIVGVQGIIRDITRRKQVERELRIKSIAVAESINAIAMADLDGNLTYVNEAFLKMWGYNDDKEVLGKAATDFWQQKTDVEAIINTLHAGGGWIGECLARRKDGSTFWAQPSATTVTDETGKPMCMMGSFVDVTDHKKAVEELKQAKEQAEKGKIELEQLNRQLEAAVSQANMMTQKAVAADLAKSEFLAGISHQIRTPLNAVIGFSQVLVEQDLTDEQRHYADLIRESSENLLQLINDVLDFSRLEVGKLNIQISECSLGCLLAITESLMRPAAMEKGLKFEILQCGELPAQIRTDFVRLRQCLINLISNSIKFTETGYVYVNVSVQQLNEIPYICFDVEDTGIGIPPDKQQLIFERFEQADETIGRRFGGTGLGLAITKRLANLLGGDVSISSQPGKGSVFTLRIPAGLDIKSQPPLDRYNFVNELNRGSDLSEQVKFSGQVLVAEDSRVNRMLIRLLLERLGLRVTTAEDGKEALNKALNQPYDLIFMDIQMPNMDGYQVVETLRRKAVTIPIVALTAHTTDHDREKCIAAGCNDCLSKPINRKELIELLSKYLASENTTEGSKVTTVKSKVN